MNTSSLEIKKTARIYQKSGRKIEVIGLQALNNSKTQEQTADDLGVPRTTLQSWKYRQQAMLKDVDPEIVNFYESPAGLVHLHQILTAIMYCFHKASGCGLPTIQMFLESSNLCKFVASSTGSLQKISQSLDDHILAFRDEEEERLAKGMRRRNITVALDETFFPASMILVMMEPISKYILTEKVSERRDKASWDKATSVALKKLNVNVIQATADEGSGLSSFVKNILGVHKAPDLFHVQQDISKAIGGYLARKVNTAEKNFKESSIQAQKAYDKVKEEVLKLPTRDLSSYPKNLSRKIKKCIELDNQKEMNDLELNRQREDQKIISEKRKEIGKLYHPFDISSGEGRTPEELEESLHALYRTIDEVAVRNDCSEKQKKKLSKSKNMIPSLKGTLAFFWTFVTVLVGDLDFLTLKGNKVFYQCLLPLFYWRMYLNRCREKEQREEIQAVIKKLENELNVRDGPWNSFSKEQQEMLSDKAQECIEIFQRSSSCVEGRNGVLSLLHHGHKGLKGRRIEVLTVIHNFGIIRKSGSSYAEDFFEQKQKSLFGYLIERVNWPLRPRRSNWSSFGDGSCVRRVA